MVAVALCLVLAAGCGGSPREGEGIGASASSSSSYSAADLSVQAEVKGGALLEATVHPIERADDHVVLTVDYSFAEDSPSTTSLDVSRLNDIDNAQPTQSSTVRLVDLPSDRVWEAGWIKDFQSATTQGRLDLEDKGQTVTAATFFGPVDVDTVDVLLPKLGLVRDVPVIEGGAAPADLASLGIEGVPVRYDAPVALESLVRSYDGESSAKKQGDAQTVVLASDVLFASDAAELSAEAAARVDEVAAQIAKVASGGTVHVVGHTDDVDTVEYNLDLSKRRATSVADRMKGKLGSSFTVTTEGKGKSEPAVEGTDDAARAANRRVEVQFTAAKAVALPGETADLPDATGPIAGGHDSVEYTAVDDDVYRIEVPSVARRDGYLVGTLVVTDVSGTSTLNQFFLSEDRYHSGQREYNYLTFGFNSSRNVTLMGPQGRVFPARYSRGNGMIRIVADSNLLGDGNPTPLGAGNSVTYTVIWPDTGEDSVTIDSPNRFRITDVPVEEE